MFKEKRKRLIAVSVSLMQTYSKRLHIAADVGDAVSDDFVVLVVKIAFKQQHRYLLRNIQCFSYLG